jgi:hypothetical protein
MFAGNSRYRNVALAVFSANIARRNASFQLGAKMKMP